MGVIGKLRRSGAGFSVIELLAMVAVVLVLAWMMMPRMTGGKASATRVKCVNNLKNVGLAFRIFAEDNGNRFPAGMMTSNGVAMASIDAVMIFGAMSNELENPKILVCPSDAGKRQGESFTNFSATNISYFASLTADETRPTLFLAGDRNMATNGAALGSGLFGLTTNGAVLSWTKEMHSEQGDVAMADGSVQQWSSSRLRQMVREQGVGTNWLVVP